MNKNVIFCYSGTGNCLDLAKNIAHGIGGADIILMRKKPVVTDVREAERVGFVFPCYAGGAPEDFLKHAGKVLVGTDAYTFAVSQSACYTGTGLFRLNEILPIKYWRAVTHQCSCIWLFPHTTMMPMLNAEEAQQRSEKLAAEIAGDILAGKISPRKPARNLLNAAENKAFPKLSQTKAKAFAVSEACVACGQCVRLCPRQNITIENGRARIGTNCAQCLSCLQYCPQNAISIGKITEKREHYHNPNIPAEELMKSILHID